MLKMTSVAALLFLVCISPAFARERLGVAVYPGAKYDQARTDGLKRSLSVRGAAYRTADNIQKVIAFYRKQGLLFLKIGSPSNELARFKKVDADVDVVVQSPWKNAQTGAVEKDTLILIFKKEEEPNNPDSSI